MTKTRGERCLTRLDDGSYCRQPIERLVRRNKALTPRGPISTHYKVCAKGHHNRVRGSTYRRDD